MKLQFRRVKELSGTTNIMVSFSQSVYSDYYTHAGFVCRRPYRSCEWLARICENRSLTDFSQRAANVGESSEQKPDRMLLLKIPSSRSWSEAFVKPHQAWDAYNNRETRIMDLNTWSRPSLFSPCARRVLRANNAQAQVETVSSMCWDTENVIKLTVELKQARYGQNTMIKLKIDIVIINILRWVLSASIQAYICNEGVIISDQNDKGVNNK